MNLAAALLLLGAALPRGPASAFFVNSAPKPPAALAPVPHAVAGPVEAMDSVAGAAANPILRPCSPLKFLLASLGVPVNQLAEGSRKCVAELDPKAMGILKTLLGALTFFG